ICSCCNKVVSSNASSSCEPPRRSSPSDSVCWLYQSGSCCAMRSGKTLGSTASRPSTKHRPYTTARLVRDCILISSSGTHRCTVKNEFKNDENQTAGGAWAGGSSRFAEREINAQTTTGGTVTTARASTGKADSATLSESGSSGAGSSRLADTTLRTSAIPRCSRAASSC